MKIYPIQEQEIVSLAEASINKHSALVKVCCHVLPLWIRLTVVLIVLMVSGCGVIKEKDIRFEYKFKAGDIFRYKLITISKITTDFLQPEKLQEIKIPSDTETSIECLFTQKVIKVDETGLADIDLFCEAVKDDTENIADKSQVDTQIGTNSGTSTIERNAVSSLSFKKGKPILKYLEGRIIHLRVGKDGYLMDVTGIDEIVNHVIGQIPESEDDSLITSAKLTATKTIKEFIADSIWTFPRDKLKPYDGWIKECNIDVPLLGNGKMQLVNTIDKESAFVRSVASQKGYECKRIDLQSIIFPFQETEGFLKTIRDKGMSVDSKGKGAGTILFACNEGRLVGFELTNNISVNVYSTGSVSQNKVCKINVLIKRTIGLQ